MKKNTIAALLNACKKDQGYILEVKSVIKTNSLVFIKVNNPNRTVMMTKNTYSKIEPFIMEKER